MLKGLRFAVTSDVTSKSRSAVPPSAKDAALNLLSDEHDTLLISVSLDLQAVQAQVLSTLPSMDEVPAGFPAGQKVRRPLVA